ncbi:MAG: N-acetyl-alpha-D-glucosaminyl L-malate synthase BshA [Candidatus Sumerlaeia bacterium]|nr:N-acetyl-alpha-D-glucosaminyl L-malate synthase BshA [Candidatus Sumerlaeia bacterium]
MKIGMVCYPTYGGSGVVATELGRLLAKRGHEIHFISTEIPFRLVHEADDNIIFHSVERFSYPLLGSELYTLSLASKIVQIANEQGLEVVHAHYAIPHAVSAWLAKQAAGGVRPKVVTTLHGTDITLVGRAPSYYPVVRFALDQSDAVTAVSEWLAEETRREFYPGRAIDVIPNFVDSTRFRPSLTPCKRSRFAPNGEKILLHISNFRPVKRVEDVVRVFARVQARMPATLLLIGDGPDYDRTVQLSHELGVSQHVHWLGKQEQVQFYFSCADLFLLPSESESFGLAAIEAMSSEIPVIASRAGGIPEVVKQGETGFLSPVGDVEDMAANALRILGTNGLGHQMGEAARRDVVARYQPESIVPMYEAVYERVLAQD